MVETIVLQTLIVCFTGIMIMSMYLQKSSYAVNNWKGKFLALSKEIKKYEKQVNKEFTQQKRQYMLDKLHLTEEGVDELIDLVTQYGVPESAINLLIDNPDVIKNLLSKVSNISKDKTGDGI